MDVLGIRTFVTPVWGEWGPQRVVSRGAVDTFSNLTDNHQWIHTDDTRCASESVYGQVIAHGFLILSLLPSLLPSEPFLITGHTHRIVRGGEWRFPAPVFPENTVQARTRLTEVRRTKRGTLLIREVEVWSSGNTKPVVTCILQLQYF